MYESQKERATYDNLADLYTIILATEHLERAYARDAVTEQEVNTIVLLRSVKIIVYFFSTAADHRL